MPGIANTVSVTIAPLISSAMPMPITVMIGTPAFLSAWRVSTARGARPFAFAVRM